MKQIKQTPGNRIGSIATGWGPSLPDEWSQEISKWAEGLEPGEKRGRAILLVKHPSARIAAEAMIKAGGGRLAKGHFYRVVHELCATPRPLPYTRSEARAAIKVLDYYRKHAHPQFRKTVENLIPFLRLVAESRGTKTTLHQYECILALNKFFRKVYGRPCNNALATWMKTAYNLNLSSRDAKRYRTRAEKIFGKGGQVPS